MAMPGVSSVDRQRYQRMLLSRCMSRSKARLSSPQCQVTLVGSAACDIAIRSSDLDLMLTPVDILIDESCLVYREDMPCYVRIPTRKLCGKIPNVMRGDCQFVLADPLRDLSEEIFDKDSPFSLRGNNWTDTKVGKTTPGLDLVPQLLINGIPRTALSFFTRNRLWPCDEIVSLIRTGEFHLAARPAPGNPDRKHDFCLSFAKAETILIKAMSPNQVLSMRWLKRIRPLIDGGLGVLTSYHLKTVLLWYSESTTTGEWNHKRPVLEILKTLDHHLKDKLLPHYFVPSMNLLAGIANSALIVVRRRLHSFFGLSLITTDLTGIDNHTRLLLTVELMDKFSLPVTSQQYGHQTSPTKFHNILQEAEIVFIDYRTQLRSNIVNGITSAKTKLSHRVLEQYPLPLHIVSWGYKIELKKTRTLINEDPNEWVRSQQPSRIIGDTVDNYMFRLYVPLEDFWPLHYIEPFLNTGGHSGTASQHRKIIMDNWLLFTDRVIRIQKSHANYIIDQLLVGFWIADNQEMLLSKQSGCVRHTCAHTDYCEQDIDKLFSIDQVTKLLLLSALDAAKALPLAFGVYTLSCIPTWSGDATADIETLENMMEMLFVPVEYAILTSIGLNTSDISIDKLVAEYERVLNPASLEYQCVAAFIAATEVTIHFTFLHMVLHLIHGWMQFVSETVH